MSPAFAAFPPRAVRPSKQLTHYHGLKTVRRQVLILSSDSQYVAQSNSHCVYDTVSSACSSHEERQLRTWASLSTYHTSTPTSPSQDISFSAMDGPRIAVLVHRQYQAFPPIPSSYIHYQNPMQPTLSVHRRSHDAYSTPKPLYR